MPFVAGAANGAALRVGLGNLCVGRILGYERRQSRVFVVMPSLWGMD